MASLVLPGGLPVDLVIVFIEKPFRKLPKKPPGSQGRKSVHEKNTYLKKFGFSLLWVLDPENIEVK